MNNVEQIAASKRAYMIAPAGFGKTHLIANAVTRHGGYRELILTHTHAGVDVLRKRIKKSQKPASFRCEIDTIAGFALRYTLAFPKSSGQLCPQPKSDAEWKQTYTCCSKLFGLEGLKEILRASYSGVYVDEYQDCSVEQHALISALA